MANTDKTHAASHTHNHTHTHDPKEIQNIVNRLSRSIGHLQSVKGMVERGEDCSDVLIQLAAVRGEITKISQILLKEHLEHCIVHAIETNDSEAIENVNKAIDKLIK